jgi:alpha-D-ribose 1-methylphosphonate 5-triphosphate diphosphatase
MGRSPERRWPEKKPMHKFVIKNAIIVKPDETVQTSVLVRDGLIAAIGNFPEEGSDHLPVIGAEGCILMPGIIDIHTDALDMEIVPRPGADMPIPVAFRELERKMSGCGFTTVFHSLHLGYDVADDALKSRYSRREVFETIYRAAAGPTLLNNKIHLRFEVTGVHAYETCLEFLEAGMISLLSIMDHTPGQGQFGMENYLQAMAKKGKTEGEALEEFRSLTSRPKIEGQRLEAMIRLAKDNGIPVASHDDDTVEKVDLMHSLGVDICEFPINLETAQHAIRRGMHVAGGASNILRGGSLSGNLDMKEAVLQGAVDTLCSDYYPPSIIHSIFRLHEDEDLPLQEAVNLATLHPARAARIHHYTGSIEPGKDADLLLVKMVAGLPVITHTIVKGNIVSQAALRNPAAVDNSTLCL